MKPGSASVAIERVLDRYAPLLARVSTDRGFSPEELDELRQDVRIRLWRALEDGERIEGVAPAYVRRTAVSAALDFIRRRRARRTVPLVEPRSTAELPIGPAARVTGPERRFVREELAEVVALVVGQLADARRVVVRLYLAGYSREEIATRLGWSEPKIRNLLYRGLADVRERLGALGVEPGRIE